MSRSFRRGMLPARPVSTSLPLIALLLMGAGTPALAQNTVDGLMEKALTMAEKGDKPAAMKLARRAEALCALPDAEARACYVAMGMAAELATLSFDTQTAVTWAGQSLAAARRMDGGAESLPVAMSLSDYAQRLADTYRFSDATDAARQAVRIFETQRGPTHQNTETARTALADILIQQGRADDAEPHYRLVLESIRQRTGEQSIYTGIALNRLGNVYSAQDRHKEAAEMYRQAMAAILTPEPIQSHHYHIAQINLAQALLAMNDPDSAQPLLRTALDALENHYSPQLVFDANNALIDLLLKTSNIEEANARATRNLDRAQRRLGARNADVGRYTVMLARIADAQGDAARAARLFGEGTAILLDTLGTDHPDTIDALHHQAGLLSKSAATAAEALAIYRKAMAAAVRIGTRGAIDPQAARILRSNERLFAAYLDHLHAMTGGTTDDSAADAFEAMQWAMTSEGSLAVTRIAAQRAGGNDAVAALEARQSRLTADRTATASAYATLAAAPEADANARSMMTARLTALDAELASLGAQIAAADPAYFDLSRARVAGLRETQQSLTPGEAILLVLPKSGGGHVMLIRADRVLWQRNEGLDSTVAGQLVASLRTTAQEDILYDENNFDFQASARLHDAIIAPLAAGLEGVTRLYVRADGPLGALPFALLASRDDRGDPLWLTDRFALETLPSLTAFALERSARSGAREQTTAASMNMVGIGAPVLKGSGEAPVRGGRGVVIPAYAAAFSTPIGGSPATLGGSPFPLADPDFLLTLEPLPGAAAELQQIGQMFAPGSTELMLGPRAIEADVRSAAKVSAARLVVFATHGLLARETLQGEPGLVLTPPTLSQRTMQNDGFLGASEVAQMRLAARLVVLSACNTGTADGRGAAGGLSGLARAFMTAGARQVVASHWQVSDTATAALMTELTRLINQSPDVPVAVHLAKAMAHVRAQPQWRSPGYWAAFTVLGIGAQ